MAGRFYVTTPIYYVNDIPHLGHAYTTIAADALRRFHQLRGEDTFMLTGTDEHGLKIQRAAEEANTTPQAFADEVSARFREAWPLLEITPDHFIRTTDASHKQGAAELWRRVEKNGDLYLGSYEDWYCVGCETFKTEKELLQPGNKCPIHLKAVEKVKEDTYFFRLSKYEKPLLELYEKHPEFVEPASRRNEVASFVAGGLRDLSVSRTSFSWGIPVPGDPKHVMFVWFDALSNYVTALGALDNPPAHGDKPLPFWPPQARAVHLIGKDILRFHTVYWPAFLMSAGIPLPSQVFVHGWLTIDGQKMSKSLRNAVSPLRLAKELGADVLRYELLKGVAFGQDGDFDHAGMLTRYNADLGKNLGNLLQRTLGLVAKHNPGKTPAYESPRELDLELLKEVEALYAKAAQEWNAIEPHRALESTMAVSALANTYVDRAAPWAEAKKGDHARIGTILATLLEVLRALSVMIAPVLPKKSDELRAQLGLPPVRGVVGTDIWPTKFSPRPAGEALGTASPLFPMYDAEATKALLDKLVPPKEVTVETEAPKTEGAAAAAPAAPTDAAPQAITYDQFSAVDLRVGVVATCEKVPKKDKLLKLTVELGEAAPRQIVAGLALTFKPEDLVGKKVVVVANLAPRDFGKGLVSHGMLLATGPSEALQLATVAGDAAPGSRLK